MDCNKCGSENKADAAYCKTCGADLKDKKNIIVLMNGKINLLAVFIGLIISLLVLFITTVLFSGMVVSKAVPVAIYIVMVIVAMAFFGSILTGALGCKNVNDGFHKWWFFKFNNSSIGRTNDRDFIFSGGGNNCNISQ